MCHLLFGPASSHEYPLVANVDDVRLEAVVERRQRVQRRERAKVPERGSRSSTACLNIQIILARLHHTLANNS